MYIYKLIARANEQYGEIFYEDVKLYNMSLPYQNPRLSRWKLYLLEVLLDLASLTLESAAQGLYIASNKAAIPPTTTTVRIKRTQITMAAVAPLGKAV